MSNDTRALSRTQIRTMPHRSSAIDAIRGLCLINIFVNHLSLGYLTGLSPSRLGFSDSADLFVLLSGVSTALAFARRDTMSFGRLAVSLWRRSLRLYAFNLVIIVGTVGLLAAVLAVRGPVGIDEPALTLLAEHGPWTLLWHAVTLRQAVGHSCILRLYIALMMIAPLLVRLATFRWWGPVPVGVLVWLLAGHFRLVMPNSLSGDTLVITILPWTVLFAIGIALGRAVALGIPCPRSRPALVFAASYLVGYLILAVIVLRVWPAAAEWWQTLNDRFWFGASKTYQSPLRVLHVLCLTYVVLAAPNAPVIRLLYRARPDHVVTRLGRNSLLVFTLGAVLAVMGNEVLDVAGGVMGAAPPVRLALEVAIVGLYLSLAVWAVGAKRRDRPGVSDAAAPAPAALALP